VKWLIDEVLSAEADALLLSGHELLVPDLFSIEVTSAFGRKVSVGDITVAESVMCFDNFSVVMGSERIRVQPSVIHHRRALELANETRRSFHDLLYLALALSEECDLVTADQKFVNGLKGTPYEGRTLWLGRKAPA
jgi:predicted nucleic acid-binding protein